MNKRLGQHFLINKQVVTDMVRTGDISKKDIVLEVGPGRGVLTEALAQKAKKVIAVEKDRELVAWNMKHKTLKNVEFVHEDILKPEIWQKKCVSCFMLQASRYKIVANIPYYITSRFLRMFLSGKEITPTPNPLPLTIRGRGRRGRALLPRPSLMVLMIQREVAERIVARDGKESLLSLSVKTYGEPKIIKIVKKGNFSPPPKVDSAIIKIICDPKPRIYPNATKNKFGSFGFNSDHPDRVKEQILSLARKAFQQKRKMLRHSLGKNIPKKYQNKRPEELELEDWRQIMKHEA